MKADQLIEVGNWTWGEESVEWELYSASAVPSPRDCTAAFCVAIIEEDKVVLVEEERGLGLPGGHIEDNETIETTLKRECLEEGGFLPNDPVLFAYRKIIASKPVTHPMPGKAYPFPISYIAYYYCAVLDSLIQRTEPDVVAVRTVELSKISELDISDKSTIELGLKSFNR